jgi:hypothetical protein
MEHAGSILGIPALGFGCGGRLVDLVRMPHRVPR